MSGFGLIPVLQKAEPGKSIFPTLVERVARAIGESYDGYADPVDTPSNWARAVSAAVVAIEAMREPTLVMKLAGDEMLPEHAGFDDDASAAYRAMIDAELK